MTSKFWASSETEPKRSFRWYCSFGAETIQSYYLRSFQKPSFEIAVAEYIMINDVNYRPGLLSWNPIEITIMNKAITYLGALEVIKKTLLGSSNLNTNFILQMFYYERIV